MKRGYWRKTASGEWCCFVKISGRSRYQSLCKRYYREGIEGQYLTRPEVVFRCGRCDGEEAIRLGLDESAPTTKRVVAERDDLA